MTEEEFEEWGKSQFTSYGRYKGSVYGNTDWAFARAIHSQIMKNSNAFVNQVSTKYEYGIVHVATGVNDDAIISVHRSGLMKYEAERWLAEFLEDGGKPDSFKIVKRPIGEWEIFK